jgi:SPFH domain / Band 7 family
MSAASYSGSAGWSLSEVKGPGLFFIVPFGIDRIVKVNLQTVAMNVPPQDVITHDNLTIRVDAVVDPLKAVMVIQNYLFGTSQATQTNLRVVLGKKTLNELLRDREKTNADLTTVIADVTRHGASASPRSTSRTSSCPRSCQLKPLETTSSFGLVPHQVTFALLMAPQVFVETGSVSLDGPVGSVAAHQAPRPGMSGRTRRRLHRRRAPPPDSHDRRR